MKRAIHIFCWLFVISAIAVVILRHRKTPPPARTSETSTPRVALAPASRALSTFPDAARPDALELDVRRRVATPTQPPRTEADFMRQLQGNLRANPQVAVALAKEAREAFGDSAESDERDRLLVDALINLQRIGDARDETLYYYRHHPAGRYRQYLWAMTGARPDPPAGPASNR